MRQGKPEWCIWVSKTITVDGNVAAVLKIFAAAPMETFS